jgi:hypothetical protein
LMIISIPIFTSFHIFFYSNYSNYPHSMAHSTTMPWWVIPTVTMTMTFSSSMDAAVSSSLGISWENKWYDEHSCLVVVYLPTPLKNDGVQGSWDDEIPNGKIKNVSKPPTRIWFNEINIDKSCGFGNFTIFFSASKMVI